MGCTQQCSLRDLSLILYSRGFFYSHSSSFCCYPFCNHVLFLRVICDDHGRFVDLTGIRLSFLQPIHSPQACIWAWRCKLTCLVLLPMLHILDAVQRQVSGSNISRAIYGYITSFQIVTLAGLCVHKKLLCLVLHI